jgi:ATP-dependent Lon protease
LFLEKGVLYLYVLNSLDRKAGLRSLWRYPGIVRRWRMTIAPSKFTTGRRRDPTASSGVIMGETDKDDLVTIIDEEDGVPVIPGILPLMPVRDVVIFTDMLLPLFVGRKKSIRAVEESVGKDGYLFLATQRDPNTEDPQPDEIFEVGTVGRILRMLKLPDGRAKTLVQGVSKARIARYVRKRGFYRVKLELIDETPMEDVDIEVEALMRNVREYSEKILALRGELSSDVNTILESIEDPGKLADLVASNLKLKIDESQEILEIVDPVARLQKVNELLSREMNLSAIQAKIQSEVKDEISKNQRDYFLREQMRAIHRELGEADDKTREVQEYQRKISKAKMPKEARDDARKQLRRLDQMHADSAEATIIRTYLDWMVEVPWSKSTRDMLYI